LEAIIWIIIIALFILSFVGLIFPVIPSVVLIWIGFLLYEFVLGGTELNTIFYIAMVLFTLMLFVADIVANSYFVNRFGGSKWGDRGAAIGVIVGSFITPPFGIIYVPFIIVFVIEILQKRPPQEALKASVGSLVGFLSGSAATFLIQLIMVVWFFILVLF